MYSVSRCVAGLLLGCAVIPMSRASAAVNLNFTDNNLDHDNNLTSTTVARGSTFSVSVVVQSGTAAADKLVGLDYFLQSSVSNVFTIVSRDTTASAFPSTDTPDSGIAGSPLTPANSTNLGGLLNNVNSPVGGSTFKVADFVISVAPAAAIGGYTLTFPPAGVQVVHSSFVSPSFVDTPFANNGTAFYNVNVTTPEPAIGVTMFGLAALALCRRRPAAR